MKRIITFALGFSLMMVSATDVQAQGFLNKVANKAKSAVKGAVEKAVNGKTGSEQAQSTAVSGSSGSEAENMDYYVEDLAAPAEYVYLHKVFNDVSAGVDQLPEDKKFGSLKEAVNSFPAQPTLEQVVSRDAAWVKQMNDFTALTARLLIDATSRNANIIQSAAAKTSASQSKLSDAQKKMLQSNAMKIFQLMQKHGIDPEKASDKDMEAFVMKMVASGELQIPGGAQNMKFEAEEKEGKQYEAITAKVQALEEKVTGMVVNESAMLTNPFGLNTTLSPLYGQLQASWMSSDAAKKVGTIEGDLVKRMNEFYTQHPNYGQKESERFYPEFWTEGRKQENAIIMEFNKGILDKWNQPILKVINDRMPILKEIEALDAEVEATFADKTDMHYGMLKNKLTSSFHTCTTALQAAMQLIYNAPVITTVVEKQEVLQ